MYALALNDADFTSKSEIMCRERKLVYNRLAGNESKGEPPRELLVKSTCLNIDPVGPLDHDGMFDTGCGQPVNRLLPLAFSQADASTGSPTVHKPPRFPTIRSGTQQVMTSAHSVHPEGGLRRTRSPSIPVALFHSESLR